MGTSGVKTARNFAGRLFGLVAFACLPGAAEAACPVANQYNFSFANQAAATLNYANTYNYTATSTALGNQAFSMNFLTNNLSAATVAGTAMPAINALITDGTAARNLMVGGVFGARSNAAFTTNYVETVFTFPVAIRDFSLQVNDIDFLNNQYRDWLQIVGTNGATSATTNLATPWGTNNSVPGPHTNASSSMVVGAAAAPVAVTVNQAVGTSLSGNNATTGTISASFVDPVTVVRVRWGNYALQTGETTTGQQAIGIQQISFCAMPNVTAAKSSTPFITDATDPNRFNIPGSDTIYTLTVTNSNASNIDAGVIRLTDVLPAQMTFFNGDIDGAGPLATNFEFIPGTSGLTLAPANIAYSNNGGASYAYTPAAGYDVAMNALRINPQGVMAANSSFQVKIRTRIK